MPELLVDFITSLDGYGAAEGWPGWWGLEGPEYLAWLGEQPEGDYTILMGANTYRLMSGFAAEGEPGTDVLAGMSKIVFSSTLKEPLAWANTELIDRDAAEAVREMKDKGRRPFDAHDWAASACVGRCSKPASWTASAWSCSRSSRGSTGSDRIYDGYPDVALDMISQPDVRRPHPVARVRSSRPGRSPRHRRGLSLRLGSDIEPDGPVGCSTSPPRKHERPGTRSPSRPCP